MKTYRLVNFSKKYVIAFSAAILILLLGISTVSVAADILVIDQSNSASNPTLWQNIPHFSPIGQEFTPSLAALDSFELWIAAWGTQGAGAEVLVNIREDTITGPVIGTSSIVALSDDLWFDGMVHFDFPSFVPLTPGDRYVVEVVVVSPHEPGVASGLIVGGEWGDTYSGGRQILWGEPQTNNDLWFKEGIDNSIPTTKNQCREHGWTNSVRHDGTPFKNQGECIQYVNTGK